MVDSKSHGKGRRYVRRTISRDLMIGLSLTVGIAVLLFGTFIYYYTVRVIQSDRKQKADYVSREVARVLEGPVWDTNAELIKQISEAYLSSGFITGMKVDTDFGLIIDMLPESHEGFMYRKRDIVYSGEKLGTVECLFSKTDIQLALHLMARGIIADGILILVVLVISIHLIMGKLLGRPLEKLIEGIGTIADGNYKSVIKPVPQMDINDIIHEVNVMSSNIAKREKLLNQLRNYLKNIVDSMPSVLIGVDWEIRVILWNKLAENITGLAQERATGCTLSDVFPQIGAEMDKIRSAMEKKEVFKDERVAMDLKGVAKIVDVTVYPLITNGPGGAVIRIDDITRRVQMEEVMIQSAKMMSVGGIAAGMAHEINNPLAGIMQNMQVIMNRMDTDLPMNIKAAEECGIDMDKIRAYLVRRNLPDMFTSVVESGLRAARIVENMLSFSRKSDDGGFAMEDLKELLDRSVELSASDYDLKKKYDFRQIEIIREYDDHLLQLSCQGSKIQQVFLNILKNGSHAMAAYHSGLKGVAQIPEERHPRFVLRLIHEGKMARIEIEDNGPGMEESVRKRIFEPFFTTKSKEGGTGLGLSVSYFIVSEDHGGTMTVESSPGKGARFIIRLPYDSHK